MNFQELIDNLFCSGSNQKYARCSENYAKCIGEVNLLSSDLAKADEKIKQMEKLLLRPAHPELTYLVEKDTAWVQSVISGYEATIIRLPLGVEFQLTNKSEFMDFVAWDWVDSFEYHKFFRCGNFAISFKAHADQFGINQVGIVLDYDAGHAYNIVIFPDRGVMLLEPQNDQIWYWEDKDLPFYVLKGAVVII